MVLVDDANLLHLHNTRPTQANAMMGGMMMLKLVEDWLKYIGEEWMTITSIFNLLHKKANEGTNIGRLLFSDLRQFLPW